ncbi:uncharacterized protein BJX67DRAFT_71245 [Aspergillus lucknowensis]|uniref:Uncharacterized protein n=1 Tax=Aspergillus lucknowensis TaxID=176173 RepID=A0ABR4LTS8_9EURO
MGFWWFCPWFRRYRRVSDSSDLGGSYQLNRVESSSTAHRSPGGMSSSVDEQTRFERGSSSSGGLSSRIRGRLSRDTRGLYRRPKRLDRGPKIPFLHFAAKHPGAHAAPATYDIGSSLMSERGYDSDAQYIATPKHPFHGMEYPTGRHRNGKPTTPRRPPPASREPDMEHREQIFGQALDTRAAANEQPAYHVAQGEHQLTWRPREHDHRVPQGFQEFPPCHNADFGSPRGRPLSPSPNSSRVWVQERQAPGPILRLQDTHRPHFPVVPWRGPIPKGVADDNIGQRPGYVTGYPGHYAPQQQAYTTSADSITGCPPQLSVRKRHQCPQGEMTTEEQSTHLGEMNIPRLLASSGSTSNVMQHSPHFNENRSSSNRGTWNATQYQGLNHPMVISPISDTSEGRLAMQTAGIEDPRSPYSPNPSGSYAGYEYEQNILAYCQGSPPKRPHLPFHHSSGLFQSEAQSPNPAPENCAADESQALGNKSIGRFESSRSAGSTGHDSHESGNFTSSRRISIGWMSEGRRIGYGYTLVPPENPSEGLERMHNESSPPRSCGTVDNNPKWPYSGNSAGREHADRRAQKAAATNNDASKTSESSFDISAILQRLNLSWWAGANFTLRTTNTSDPGNDSGGSSFFGMLSNRRKNNTEPGSNANADADNPWEFCSWVRTSQNWSGQQGPQQNIFRSHENAETQLMEKLIALRRRGGAWATTRKVSEIARSLERRAVAKLVASTEQFPAVQRTATRVLRLKSPDTKERLGRIHDVNPIFSVNQFGGNEDRESFRDGTMSSESSDDWNSLYEECLEGRPIPE